VREATLTEFRNQAKSVFDEVERGETVRVYRNGRPIADSVPRPRPSASASFSCRR
jgi:antitoxin (DNA-binding transcriptional repressor) of toxin-antitoxin stability system